MYKVIGADGIEYGPVTADQLRQWIAEGRADLNTRVLPDGATEWKALGQLPEFAAPAAAPGLIAPIPPGPLVPGPSVAEQVNGPAIGLIVAAVLGALLKLVLLICNLLGASFASHSRMPSDAWVNLFSGALGAVSSVVGIALSVVILLGALKMRKLESHGFAMAASVIAMVPCLSPCCFLGLPIGIWAVVVLSKPEVKNAFH
jgi:hypothetical protein